MKAESQNQERHTVRNTAAAVVGAMEGFKEGLQEEHLMKDSARAIHNVRDVSRSAVGETRRQWNSAEVKQLRTDAGQTAQTASEKLQGGTGRVQEAKENATAQMHESRRRTRRRVRQATHSMQERIEHGAGGVRQTATHVVADGRDKARAVAETSRRARTAPAHIKDDLVAATKSYTQSMTKGWGMYAGAGALGAVAFVVLTVGLVVAFNALLGVPAGHFITVGLYLAGAGIIMAVGRSQRKKHRKEANEHVEEAREEARDVARPVRIAFHKDDNR